MVSENYKDTQNSIDYMRGGTGSKTDGKTYAHPKFHDIDDSFYKVFDVHTGQDSTDATKKTLYSQFVKYVYNTNSDPNDNRT